MIKTFILTIVFLIPLVLSAQEKQETEYNFGFEKISFKKNLPVDWVKWGTDNYSLNVDTAIKHSGSYSLSIQSIRPQRDQAFGCAAYAISPDFKGRKIEVKAYMKLQDVENGKIGLMLRIDQQFGKTRLENMQEKKIKGTSDWKLYSVRLSLPKEPTKIYIGAILTGTGKIWVDDFEVLVDGIDINKAAQKTIPSAKDDIPVTYIDTMIVRTDSSVSVEKPVIAEKVYLSTDRDTYFPGDDIWFKAYLVDGTDLLLGDHSKNLHVELISPTSGIVDSRIIRMENGLGNGDFRLPELIHSGTYQIRAYTNYMRNFGDKLFFIKEFKVINTVDAIKTFNDTSDFSKPGLELQFFPEGGSLVDSVASTVAFKAVDSKGFGCDVRGQVYSSTGELITSFASTHKGLGSFTFSPVPGNDFFAIAADDYGDTIKKKLPRSFSSGMVLNAYRNSGNKLVVTFKTNKGSLPSLSDKDLQLTVSKHNDVYKTFNIQINALSNYFILPDKDLPDGIFMLTLAAPDKGPICERLIFIRNTKDLRIKLDPGKPLYNQRDSVSVKIALSGNEEVVTETYLSFSAFRNPDHNISSISKTSISSWFLLESEVKGFIEDPSYYFDPSNPGRLRDLDLLLLTQGWRDFRWKYKDMNYPPESGFSISGRVRKVISDEPLPKAKVNIAIFKSVKPVIKTSRTDSSGRFLFDEIDLNGNARLVVSSSAGKDKLKGLILLDSLKYIPPPVAAIKNPASLNMSRRITIYKNQQATDELKIKNDLNAYIQYAEIKNALQKKYKLSDTINPGEVTITAKKTEKFESARDRSHRYLMAFDPDYEVEITPQSEIFNNLGRLIDFRLHMHSNNMSGLAIRNPLVLLDGMDVGWEGIMDLPVEWIERFDALRPGSPAAMIWGERGKGGVISVVTRSGAPTTNDNPVYHSVNVNFAGYNEPRIFYSPVHHTTLESDYKPDLRTTLFWEPNIKLENNNTHFVNYFNADNPGFVKIVVEGITSTGIPVTGQTEYEVK
jgi:hypothetical protein